MPVPTSFTEDSLAEYMHSSLGAVATALGLTSPLSYHEAVVDTLLAYGNVPIAQATDVRKLRALARREAWRVAQAHSAGYVSFTADGQSMSLSDLSKSIQINLSQAEANAAPYDSTGGFVVTVGAVQYNDYYSDTEPTE